VPVQQGEVQAFTHASVGQNQLKRLHAHSQEYKSFGTKPASRMNRRKNKQLETAGANAGHDFARLHNTPTILTLSYAIARQCPIELYQIRIQLS